MSTRGMPLGGEAAKAVGGSKPNLSGKDSQEPATTPRSVVPLDTARIYRIAADDASSAGRTSPGMPLVASASNTNIAGASKTQARKGGQPEDRKAPKQRSSPKKGLGGSITLVEGSSAEGTAVAFAKSPADGAFEPEDSAPQGSKLKGAESKSKSLGKVRLVPLDGQAGAGGSAAGGLGGGTSPQRATPSRGQAVDAMIAPAAGSEFEPEPLRLSLESTIQDFRAFQQAMRHPGIVLNLVAREDDEQVYSEFDELCNELLVVLGELEASLEDIIVWKDDFLKQSVPSDVKLEITLLFARLFRRHVRHCRLASLD
ncbi:hypothetical protein HK105_202364 [Polyrhizophydium stewartii]|uniref:Uncharacterized protein n=1 Tax=Polyrhizophydium stewartii TaxID=2732419 RepID=A0ABR4NEK1_9FUNG